MTNRKYRATFFEYDADYHGAMTGHRIHRTVRDWTEAEGLARKMSKYPYHYVVDSLYDDIDKVIYDSKLAFKEGNL